MKDSLANKKSLKIWAVMGLVIAICIMCSPLKFESIEWTDSASYAGSFASVWGIILVFIQMMGVIESNLAIEEEVTNTKEQISKIMEISDISRHSQMISELHSYVANEKWDLAHLRLLEVNAILTTISENKSKYNITYSKLSASMTHVKEDLKAINDAIHKGIEIDRCEIANHLDELSPILSEICAQLKNQ